jgi:subtilisin-like proprotein convertase family protein
MQLRLAITDLYGTVRARLDRFTDAEVTIPWNDSRTAQVTLDTSDLAALNVLPLERMLKVWLAQEDGTDLVFWGPILSPSWRLHERKVTVNAHDISVRLKHHYLNARDAAVTTPGTEPDDYKGSVPVSFVGLRRLRDAGKNASAENGAGIPDLGVINGTNSHDGAAKDFPQTTTVGAQTYPAASLTVDDQTLFPSGGGTIYLGATLGPAPGYVISGATQTLTYTGKATGSSTVLSGVSGWSGSGTVAAGTSVISDSGEFKRMLCERGENVWEKMQELAQLPTGPDFELAPYDGPAPTAADGLNESTDVPKTIAGGGPTSLKASSNIVVTDPGFLQQANVSVWIDRNETSDVDLVLVAPDGRKIKLVEDTALTASGADFGTGSAGASRTIFDDFASNAIENGSPPYVGYFIPHQEVGNLGPMAVAGTWTLQVFAGAGTGVAGTLHNWAINFVPFTEPPPTPPYAKLNTFDKKDASPGGAKDRRTQAQFIFGYARENVEELTYTPSGDSVRNRVVAVTNNTGGAGEAFGTGATNAQTRTNLASRQRYGNYVQWEAAGSLAQAASPADTLGSIAEYWLESLSFPPQQIELKPRTAPAFGAAPGLVRYLREFAVGDLVRLSARSGQVGMLDPATGAPVGFVDMIVREVVLAQLDEVGNLDTRLTAVPFVPAPPAGDKVDTS